MPSEYTSNNNKKCFRKSLIKFIMEMRNWELLRIRWTEQCSTNSEIPPVIINLWKWPRSKYWCSPNTFRWRHQSYHSFLMLKGNSYWRFISFFESKYIKCGRNCPIMVPYTFESTLMRIHISRVLRGIPQNHYWSYPLTYLKYSRECPTEGPISLHKYTTLGNAPLRVLLPLQIKDSLNNNAP